MKNKEQIEVDSLFVQYLSGQASEMERQQALEWINSSQGNAYYYKQFRKAYLASIAVGSSNEIQTEQSWERVKTRYYIRKQKANSKPYKGKQAKFISTLIRYAAVVLIAFILGGIVLSKYNSYRLDRKDLVYNQVVAPLGSKAMVVLSDGTKVWLNAGSKLRYPVNFLSDSRDVYLEGEAYFDVTKQMDRKFIVHTSDINVKVYGTEFNVKAYPEEKTIQTTLVRGMVTIENADGKKNILAEPVMLKPNQLATFTKTVAPIKAEAKRETKPESKRPEEVENKANTMIEESKPLVIVPQVDHVIYTSWKESNWIIKSEELESLAVKLERRYDVKIQIKGDNLKKYKFSGTLRDETLEQVLDIIKIIAPIQYTIDKKSVVFEENKSFVKTYNEMLINR